MSDPARLRERLEVPLKHVRRVGVRAVESFPVRVWQQFSRNNGFLLSAGMAYFVLFALFALLYVAFASIGLWFGWNRDAIDAMIEVINTYVPGLIGTDGLVSPQDISTIVRDSAGLLGTTGVIAIVVAIWTAIGAVTFTRRAVRDILGLPFDDRSYFLLKVRDFLGAITFGGALLLGAALATLGVVAITQVFTYFGWSVESGALKALGRSVSVLVAFLVDTAALASLVRFLTGTSIPWRAIIPGALLGGAAMVTLQLGLGLLVSWVPSNPLLATFAVMVGLLLWCRWLSIVVLVAASWIAVTADDLDHPLVPADERAARIKEREALVLAAEVHFRRAQRTLEDAPWYRRRSARRAARDAQDELIRAREELEQEQRMQQKSLLRRALSFE